MMMMKAMVKMMTIVIVVAEAEVGGVGGHTDGVNYDNDDGEDDDDDDDDDGNNDDDWDNITDKSFVLSYLG